MDYGHTWTWLRGCISRIRKPGKHTVNKSTEVDEPRSNGNAENDLVTIPDLHSEGVASEQET
jgi:hypothetical protein